MQLLLVATNGNNCIGIENGDVGGSFPKWLGQQAQQCTRYSPCHFRIVALLYSWLSLPLRTDDDSSMVQLYSFVCTRNRYFIGDRGLGLGLVEGLGL